MKGGSQIDPPHGPRKKTTLKKPSAIRVKGYFQSNSTAFKSNRFVIGITKNVLSFIQHFFPSESFEAFHLKASTFINNHFLSKSSKSTLAEDHIYN